MPHFGFAILLGAATIAGVGAGRLARHERAASAATQVAPRVERLGGYRHVRPLLECAPPQGTRRLDGLRARLEAAADRADVRVSVHVRDLESGEAVDIAPEARFDPAGLRRLAALMAVKAAEPGTAPPLDAPVAADALHRTLTDLGLPAPGGAADAATASELGALFQYLFNATYLGPRASERALASLAHAGARGEGIAAGVGHPVSRVAGDVIAPDGARHRHDCGIVHLPWRPYVLCVMARGPADADFEAAVRSVSAPVHEALQAGGAVSVAR